MVRIIFLLYVYLVQITRLRVMSETFLLSCNEIIFITNIFVYVSIFVSRVEVEMDFHVQI
jgi:hypothetical protein